MTGDFVTAESALQWGLVNKVVPDGELEVATQELIGRLSKSPFQALIATKRLINQSCLAPLATQLEAEREAMMWSATTKDFQEGVSAFLEKRAPRFAEK
jgi:enoyl-CoA hydratase/carnithine racemase